MDFCLNFEGLSPDARLITNMSKRSNYIRLFNCNVADSNNEWYCHFLNLSKYKLLKVMNWRQYLGKSSVLCRTTGTVLIRNIVSIPITATTVKTAKRTIRLLASISVAFLNSKKKNKFPISRLKNTKSNK